MDEIGQCERNVLVEKMVDQDTEEQDEPVAKKGKGKKQDEGQKQKRRPVKYQKKSIAQPKILESYNKRMGGTYMYIKLILKQYYKAKTAQLCAKVSFREN